MIQKRIEEINRTGLHLDLGRIIDDAFDTYKKIAINAGLGYLIMFAVVGVILFGAVSILAVSSEMAEQLTNLKSGGELPLGFLLTTIAGGLVFSLLAYPILAGFLKMCKTADDTGNAPFDDLFYYFKAPYFANIILYVLTTTVISSSISLFFQFALDIQWLGVLVGWIISLLLLLALPMIIFGNVSFYKAMLYSVKIVSKSPFVFLGAIVIAIIFAGLGIFALCIGILFTYPFINAMIYTLYKHSIGFEEETKEWEQIGTNEE